MHTYLQDKLKHLKFKNITPIQKKFFEEFDKPFNLVGIAPTGTGKTHAYLLPILSKIDWNKNIIQAVIVVPTNELVFQVFNMLKEIEQQNSKVKIFYGGMDKQKILSNLEKKQPPLVITTLSKLSEYSQNFKKLNVFKASYLVLDEADMLFDQESLNLLDPLLIKWKPKILLFSASITLAMKPFINKYFGKSLFLDVNSEQKINLKYYFLESTSDKRINNLIHFSKNLNPYLALIFVSQKKDQLMVYKGLKEAKLNVLNFSSDLSVKQRKKHIAEIKKMKYQFVISSDLTARGLDLDISWVIHYDLPSKNLEFFKHRSGRTGRMGKDGSVLVIYNEKDKITLDKIKKMNNIDFHHITLTKTGFREEVKKEFRPNNQLNNKNFNPSHHKYNFYKKNNKMSFFNKNGKKYNSHLFKRRDQKK
jgi:ATP-dependent RNA helicase CshB